MEYLEDSVDGPRALARDLFASAAELPGTARAAIYQAAQVVADRATQIADDYGSASIPPTITALSNTDGAEVDAGGDDVPMAGLWEYGNRGGGSRDTFTHPVFGMAVTVTEERHPFLAPALDEAHVEVYEAAEGAFDSAFTPHRLRPDSETI